MEEHWDTGADFQHPDKVATLKRIKDAWDLFVADTGLSPVGKWTHCPGACEKHRGSKPNDFEVYWSACETLTQFGVDGPPCPKCSELFLSEPEPGRCAGPCWVCQREEGQQ